VILAVAAVSLVASAMSGRVVVETVSPHSAAQQAGLQAGDVLLRWAGVDSGGPIESPFDVSRLEIERAPRGPVTLEGQRGTAALRWELGPGEWGLETRPDLTESLLSRYRQAREQAAAGRTGEAVETWRSALAEMDDAEPRWLGAWWLCDAAQVLARQRAWRASDPLFEEAAARGAKLAPALGAQVLVAWARVLELRGDWKQAEIQYRAAAEGGEGLLLAQALAGAATAAARQGVLDKAEATFAQALAIQEKSAPESLARAKTLNGLGILAQKRGDLALAEQYHVQALAIREKAAPGGVDVATSLNNLGVVARASGDLGMAEQRYLQALAINEALAPGSLAVAASLDNLGLVARLRGELANAEGYLHRALDLQRRQAPDNVDVGFSLNSLGIVAMDRGEVAQAEQYHRQALAIYERLAPGSLEVAMNLDNLSLVMSARGKPRKAAEYALQALAIHERLTPGGPDVAYSLDDLSLLSWKRGDLQQAEEYGLRAVALREKTAAGSLDLAGGLDQLGEIELDRGDAPAAERHLRRALALEEALAPGSELLGRTLAALAAIEQRRGRLEAAATLFERALDAFESQTAHLGGSADLRSSFRAAHLEPYRSYVDVLVRLQRPERAFQVLERSRARALLEVLAQGHVDIHRGVAPELLDRKRSLEADLAAKHERRLRLLSGPHREDQLSSIDREIETLGGRLAEVREQIRASSPGYGALAQPQPLDADDTRRLLDGDTLLAEFCLGRERSWVFAMTTGGLDVYPLPRRSEIEAAVRRAYATLSVNDPRAGREPLEALSRMLLARIGGRLAAKRLAIVADGALQYVPFGALRTPQGAPLIADHEIVSLPSASTLLALRQQIQGRASAPKLAAVLADPVFAADDERLQGRRTAQNASAADAPTSDLLTRAADDFASGARGGLRLSRLPNTRQEADAIVALAPAGQALEALDFDASRATARRADLSQYRILHFATHGLLDSVHPELSGLVFSLVDASGRSENGFFGLADVYDLDLRAGLVVLSACDTALGKEIAGEGLVGLARAFMYAGAPRVVASLWRVPERATAELMSRFYRAMLVDGLTPAAALRRAQTELSREKQWSAPYFWAGFTLQGEWR
jgi:CHAT domain-containing protein/tetratricopeptide (TPR) repeat protein